MNNLSIKSSFENSTSLDDNIKEFIKNNKVGLSILTPCFGGMCHVNYMCCLIETLDLCKKYGITISVDFCKNDSLVSRARNNLVARAMNKPTTTHILFIDNDITWNPIDILKLIISDKSIIGGVYPLKKYMWDTLISENITIEDILKKKRESQFDAIISDSDFLQHRLLKYNINFLGNTLSIENNLCKIRHLATGFMMFKRETIEQMSKAFPSTKYTDDVGFLLKEENEYAYALFDCGVEDGHYYSEDWLFCHRWNKMGGNIYVDVSINLKHTGSEDYNGSFIASLI